MKLLKFLFLLLLFSCYPQDTNQNKIAPTIERNTEKVPDPKKQKICKKKSKGNCEDEEDCEEVCDDIFRRRSAKKDCYELPPALVFEFEHLISVTEEGDIEEIDEVGPGILECMLDIEERSFAEAVEEMNRGESEEFLAFIAESEEFADVLEEEDDEFNVLKQLLHNLKGNDLTDYLAQEIDDDKILLLLASEHNEFLWKWLDNYVDEVCDGGDSEECPGGENIGAYCKALIDAYKRDEDDWEDFIDSADLFADEYEEEVDDDEYEYEITDRHASRYSGDFRDYCALKAPAPVVSAGGGASPSSPGVIAGVVDPSGGGGGAPGSSLNPGGADVPELDMSSPGGTSSSSSVVACPSGADRDQSNQNFGTFTFASFPPSQIYIHSNYRQADGVDPTDRGSVTPSQDTILSIDLRDNDSDGTYELGGVTVVNHGFDSTNNTYYFYFGNNRVTLESRSAVYTENSIEHRVLTPSGNTSYTNIDSGASVWLAVEGSDGNCQAYGPAP